MGAVICRRLLRVVFVGCILGATSLMLGLMVDWTVVILRGEYMMVWVLVLIVSIVNCMVSVLMLGLLVDRSFRFIRLADDSEASMAMVATCAVGRVSMVVLITVGLFEVRMASRLGLSWVSVFVVFVMAVGTLRSPRLRNSCVGDLSLIVVVCVRVMVLVLLCRHVRRLIPSAAMRGVIVLV